MSLELLDKLESRVQNALETIELQQMELEEERTRAQELELRNQQLEQRTQELEQQLAAWNSKAEGLLNKLSQADAEAEPPTPGLSELA
ncbi:MULTISPECIES: cell division protein ZapB [Ferrimonas]|uniref:cell division protein ZapB n=1 Tax=Ferrimonas TaxID=44011 RepID=UPI00041B3AA1|nr:MULTISPECIES: cell division protein ZapB [Ferrimonas]USD37383.1 cell division protein ZapB [Ferrimonas sp. SCSIO 43195]